VTLAGEQSRTRSPARTRYDVVIVGAGHNGLVAATLLARAGQSVLVLERLKNVGGAAISGTPFPGVDVRLSRYSYLVSLFPETLRRELGLTVELRRRSVSSYTPDGASGILDRSGEIAPRFYGMVGRVAPRLFATLMEPLRPRAEVEALLDDSAAWQALFETPLSETLERELDSDLERGIVLTDATIGTFADAGDPALRQNRCFLYHVIGNGTGRWDLPVGGMGALTAQLSDRALEAGAEIRTGTEVTSIDTDGTRAEVQAADGTRIETSYVLVNVAPHVLDDLLGVSAAERAPKPEGAQLKINMLLARLPRLKDSAVDPADAYAGTFHVNESYEQLQRAYQEASGGSIPTLPPCELYCHSLSDPSILGADIRAAGAQTLTLFGLHMPARLFDDPDSKRRAVDATLASMNAVLAEPIEDCLWHGPDGEVCLEALTPSELEAELAMPGGHIFHRDLSWPFAEREEEIGTWGVETSHSNVFVCGAGARRGGGVSGIPGHNAARAVLEAEAAPRT
jgi:phytoene dehydrogenase-like protein